MTNEQVEFIPDQDSQLSTNKYNETFSPVIVTDTVGAVFLGSISLILIGVVAGLLVYIRKLEARFKKPEISIEQ